MAPALQAVWGRLFDLAQMIDPVYAGGGPLWRLSEEEAKMLAQASESYIKTIAKGKKQTAIKRFLDKHFPLIAFTASLAVVVQPRIVTSFEAHRHARTQTKPPDVVRFDRRAQARSADAYNQRVRSASSAGDAADSDPDAQVDAAFRDWEDAIA